MSVLTRKAVVLTDSAPLNLPRYLRRLVPPLEAGATNREIAAQLCLAEGTVKQYLHRIALFLEIEPKNGRVTRTRIVRVLREQRRGKRVGGSSPGYSTPHLDERDHNPI